MQFKLHPEKNIAPDPLGGLSFFQLPLIQGSSYKWIVESAIRIFFPCLHLPTFSNLFTLHSLGHNLQELKNDSILSMLYF